MPNKDIYKSERATWFLNTLDKVIKENGLIYKAPHVSMTFHDEYVLEYWHNKRKIAIYFEKDDSIFFIKVWGPDILNEMSDGFVATEEDTLELWKWLFYNETITDSSVIEI